MVLHLLLYITFYFSKKLREREQVFIEFVTLALFTISNSLYLLLSFQLCHFLIPLQLCSHILNLCCYFQICFYMLSIQLCTYCPMQLLFKLVKRRKMHLYCLLELHSYLCWCSCVCVCVHVFILPSGFTLLIMKNFSQYFL